MKAHCRFYQPSRIREKHITSFGSAAAVAAIEYGKPSPPFLETQEVSSQGERETKKNFFVSFEGWKSFLSLLEVGPFSSIPPPLSL